MPSTCRELTLFSYEVLGLVGRNGAAPHDLLRMARRRRMLDWAGESQYYVEPKRLARLGYLEARKEPGQTRERTVYTLTEAGAAELPHRRKYLVLVTGFMRRLLELHNDLVDEVDRKLA
jgi:DNA-binding PadR family transcriptional regulator